MLVLPDSRMSLTILAIPSYEALRRVGSIEKIKQRISKCICSKLFNFLNTFFPLFEIMSSSNSAFQIMESFFRIHFAKNEEILEDLLPVMKKISPSSPIPNSVKTALEDSGPCIYLLNKLIISQYNHYRPTNQKILTRGHELEELYDTLVKVRGFLSSELEFQSLINAIASYHRKETDYPQTFNFFLNIIDDHKILKSVISFLNEKSLHTCIPYVPDDNSEEGDFSFDEVSDNDPDLQQRIRIDETIPEILVKCSHKDDFALSLFLGDVIDHQDLLNLSPSLKHSKLTYDPVAIGPHDHITQLVAKQTEIVQNRPRYPLVQHSYRNSHNYAEVMPFTGASPLEEFTENRRYLCVYTPLKPDEQYAKGIRVDQDITIDYIDTACQFLHDSEIESDVLLKATADIGLKNIRPSLTSALSSVYGYQSDDIIDFLTSEYDASKDIVMETLINALTKQSLNYYRSLSDAYSRLTKEAFRTFPHPENINICLRFFRQKISSENSNAADYLDSLFECRDKTTEFSMTFAQTNFVTLFCLFYKFYIQENKGNDYLMPISPLYDSATNWFSVYEGIIKDGLHSLNIIDHDLLYDSYHMKGMTHMIDLILKQFKEINTIPEENKLNSIHFKNKRVRFQNDYKFDVPVLNLIILPNDPENLGLE